MNKAGIKTRGLRHAESIKAELRAMMAATQGMDFMPAFLQAAVKYEQVNGFSDLHEIMDANTLGAVDALMREQEVSEEYMGLVATREWNEEEARVQTRLDVLNVAQDEVDHWIKTGGLREP